MSTIQNEDGSKMDACAILNLPARSHCVGSLRVEQVRTNYKLLAMQLHPDKRPNGMTNEQATQMFQVLTNAYREVLNDLDVRKIDRSFDELREEARSNHSSGNNGGKPPLGEGKKFDAARFNHVFEEVRIKDPVFDNGYGDWMKRVTNEADLRRSEEERNRRNLQLQKYREPEAMGEFANKKGAAFSELGLVSVSDYSGRIDRGKIDYSDYQLAHTTSRLADPKDVRRADDDMGHRRSIEAVKAARANVPYEMSQRDRHLFERRQQELRNNEERRLQQLRTSDQLIGKMHAAVNRLLLA